MRRATQHELSEAEIAENEIWYKHCNPLGTTTRDPRDSMFNPDTAFPHLEVNNIFDLPEDLPEEEARARLKKMVENAVAKYNAKKAAEKEATAATENKKPAQSDTKVKTRASAPPVLANRPKRAATITSHAPPGKKSKYTSELKTSEQDQLAGDDMDIEDEDEVMLVPTSPKNERPAFPKARGRPPKNKNQNCIPAAHKKRVSAAANKSSITKKGAAATDKKRPVSATKTAVKQRAEYHKASANKELIPVTTKMWALAELNDDNDY